MKEVAVAEKVVAVLLLVHIRAHDCALKPAAEDALVDQAAVPGVLAAQRRVVIAVDENNPARSVALMVVLDLRGVDHRTVPAALDAHGAAPGVAAVVLAFFQGHCLGQGVPNFFSQCRAASPFARGFFPLVKFGS